jgi:methylmalonyl-CoA/ethylmalonyl-CoA epimerase
VREVRFDHIALAAPRLADATPLLVGVLGGQPAYGAPSGTYRFGQWRFANGARLEVLEPLGANGFLHRFLAARGPGIHHVTFKVPDLRQACDRAAAHGYTIVGYRDDNPAWKEAFLHPKEALGIVVQLAESAPRGGPASLPPWTPPPAPPDPPPPVEVLGLRMRARSPDRAGMQWGSVLDGEQDKTPDGALVYRWPRSPLRLVVEIDPEADEGPVAIEVRSERALPLPATAGLGAWFRPVGR